MKHFYFYNIFFFICLMSFAQQNSQFSQYMYNTMSINPAYAGTREIFSAIGVYRNQWVGIDGAPETFSFAAHAPIGGRSLANFGLDASSDRIGVSTQKSITVNFSYILPIGGKENTRLSWGVKGGLENLDININQLQVADINDPALYNASEFSPVVGIGGFLYTDNWYLGLSTPNVLQTQRYEDASISVYTNRMHLYFVGGYVYEINRDLKFKPAFMVKSVIGAPLALDLSSNFYLYDKVSLGVSYRLSSALSAF